MLYWAAVLLEVGAVWLFLHGYPVWTVLGVFAVGMILVLVLDGVLDRTRAASRSDIV